MAKEKVDHEVNNAQSVVSANFVEGLRQTAASKNANTGGMVFDSAAAVDYVAGAISESGSKVPLSIGVLMDDMDDKGISMFTHAILDSVNDYEMANGCNVSPDLLHYALTMAGRTTEAEMRKYAFDSATSGASDSNGLQPNRASVAILSSMGAACPWIHYLPADIGSRQGKLAIISHLAGSASGGYAQNGLMDGTNSGDAFTFASRIHRTNPVVTTGAVGGKITAIQTDDETCDQAAASVKLVRGRSIVYVLGIPVAKEVDSSGSGSSPISGIATIGGTSYQFGGAINTDTGVFAITTTPALPISYDVVVEGFLDFERDSTLTPSIITSANIYDIWATSWRVITQQTPDARAQFANELGLDPYSESIISAQTQGANERHYRALRHARRLSENNVDSFNFDWSARNVQLNAATIFNDVAPVLGRVSQQMANDTIDHGITHLYVGKKLMSLIQGLPSNIFEPSGISAKPYIYRIGKLFGLYDVMYTPKGLAESSTAAQMLCVGRATNVTRNCVVMGDCVPPTVTPLAVNTDLKTGAGIFGIGFISVNPHSLSAKGAAMIEFTNLY